MTAKTLLRSADAKRLAELARTTKTAVTLERDGVKITFTPHQPDPVDERVRIVL